MMLLKCLKVRNQNGMNKDKEFPMLRRLFIVLQSFCSIPPFIVFYFWWEDYSDLFHFGISFNPMLPYFGPWLFRPLVMFFLSFIPYGLIILGKWIIYGTFNIFKIGQDIKPKKRDSSRKDDSEIGFTSKSDSNRDSYEPPFPDGF